jgi:hypothetical protein
MLRTSRTTRTSRARDPIRYTLPTTVLQHPIPTPCPTHRTCHQRRHSTGMLEARQTEHLRVDQVHRFGRIVPMPIPRPFRDGCVGVVTMVIRSLRIWPIRRHPSARHYNDPHAYIPKLAVKVTRQRDVLNRATGRHLRRPQRAEPIPAGMPVVVSPCCAKLKRREKKTDPGHIRGAALAAVAALPRHGHARGHIKVRRPLPA